MTYEELVNKTVNELNNKISDTVETVYILKNVMFYISKTNYVHLIGKVYNHPIYDDGTEVVTSEVVDATRPASDSTLFTTKSGSHYLVNMKDIERFESVEE